MKDENLYDLPDQNDGDIRIADEVISIIASLAAMEVPGVAGMSTDLVGDIAELLGKKNLSKGVKVHMGEKEVVLDLYVVLEYGVFIPDIAVKIQSKVKESVENMSDMEVVEINIHVQGVVHADTIKETQSQAIIEPEGDL